MTTEGFSLIPTPQGVTLPEESTPDVPGAELLREALQQMQRGNVRAACERIVKGLYEYADANNFDVDYNVIWALKELREGKPGHRSL